MHKNGQWLIVQQIASQTRTDILSTQSNFIFALTFLEYFFEEWSYFQQYFPLTATAMSFWNRNAPKIAGGVCMYGNHETDPDNIFDNIRNQKNILRNRFMNILRPVLQQPVLEFRSTLTWKHQFEYQAISHSVPLSSCQCKLHHINR